LWVANWQTTCPSIPTPQWSDWTFWQTADNGNVAGIGSTDTDVFNGSLSDLQMYVNPSQVAVDMAGASTSTDLAGAGPSSDLAGAGPSADLAGGAQPDAAPPFVGGGRDAGLNFLAPGAPSGCSCELGGRARTTSPLALALALVLLALAFRVTVARRAARRRLALPRR
jgi:hypothetical protein